MKLTAHLLLEWKLGMIGAIPLCHHGVCRGSFTFYRGEYWTNYFCIHDTCTRNAETLTDKTVISHGDY